MVNRGIGAGFKSKIYTLFLLTLGAIVGSLVIGTILWLGFNYIIPLHKYHLMYIRAVKIGSIIAAIDFVRSASHIYVMSKRQKRLELRES
jgi:hypothetical protein